MTDENRLDIKRVNRIFTIKGEVLGALQALNWYLKDDEQIKINNALIFEYRKIVDDEIEMYHNNIDLMNID